MAGALSVRVLHAGCVSISGVRNGLHRHERSNKDTIAGRMHGGGCLRSVRTRAYLVVLLISLNLSELRLRVWFAARMRHGMSGLRSVGGARKRYNTSGREWPAEENCMNTVPK